MKVISIVMKKMKRQIAIDQWVKAIWFGRVIAEIKERYYVSNCGLNDTKKLKREKFDLYILNKKAAMIGLMFRAKLANRLKKSNNYPDIEKSKL